MKLSDYIRFFILRKGDQIAGFCVFSVLPKEKEELSKLPKKLIEDIQLFCDSFVDGYLGRIPIVIGHHGKKTSFIHVKNKKIVFSHSHLPISRCPKYEVEKEDYEGLKNFLNTETSNVSFSDYPDYGGFVMYLRSSFGDSKVIRPITKNLYGKWN